MIETMGRLTDEREKDWPAYSINCCTNQAGATAGVKSDAGREARAAMSKALRSCILNPGL